MDLHGNAYQHKTVKMFDVVSALQLFSLTSCYWLSFSLVIFLFSQLYTDMWRLADPHIHVMGKKVGSIKLKIIFKKILNCHVMLYRIKNVSSNNLIPFLTQGALTLSQACEDETALTKLTDGWLIGEVG